MCIRDRYKTLDKNTSTSTESYEISSVKETDYDTYTCEALLIKDNTLYVLDFSDFREPITCLLYTSRCV